MEEIEDDWTSADDSEDERDIEIALYSQIHFDPVPEAAGHENENYISLNTENQRFNVGVEEVSLPVTTSFNEKIPADGESRQRHAKRLLKLNKEHIKAMDAIYITSSDEDDCVELVSSDKQSVQEIPLLELNEFNEFDTVNNRSLIHGVQSPANLFSSDTPCLNASEENITSEDESMKSDSIEDFDKGDMLILDAYPPPEDSSLQNKSSKNLHSSSYKNINQSHMSKKETIYVYDDENVYSKSSSEVSSHSRNTIKTLRESTPVLPFSITKAPVNVEKESLSDNSDSMHEDAETEKADCMVQNLAQTAMKQNFLKFSKTGRREDSSRIELKKKKKLSKQEAAVKPRTPPVYVRKPPVVKVSYHQDSDTNTDYSDSDMSFTSTPKKKPVNRSKATTSKMVGDGNRDNSQDESSSSSEKTDAKSVHSKSTSSHRVKLKITSTKTEERYSTVKKTQKYVNRDMGNKGPTTEESDTDSSVSSHGAGLEEDAAHDPALDFNLEGGVDALLKRKPVDDPYRRWQIVDKDRYQIPVNTSRYFNPFSITCRNCNEEGHKAIDCPKPKKSLCIFCGRTGHVFQACPDSICYNCSAPGHRLNECVERRRNWRHPCDRCWMLGHFEEDCPDQWRQFHLTRGTVNGKAKSGSKKRSNPKVYCYNCGQEGHFGYSCKGSMMNNYVVPNYPFIAKYQNSGYKERRSKTVEKEKKVSKKEKSKTMKCDKKYDESSRAYRKKAHQPEDSSKRKDKDSKTKNAKAKKSFHKEDKKKTPKSPSHNSKKHHDTNDSKKDRSERDFGEWPGGGRDRIVTNTTVFSFQNTSTDYYAEEDYSPPKKRSMPERHNETAGNPLRRDHPPKFKDRKSKQSRHHQPGENSEDEMMHHQVFDNEWWNADNGSANKKRRKKQDSREDAAWTSQKGRKHTGNENSQYGHGNQHKTHRREMTDHQETQSIQVTIHTSQHSDSTADFALCRRMQRRKEHFKSVYFQNRAPKKKTGFQMDGQFRSLSKSCKNNR